MCVSCMHASPNKTRRRNLSHSLCTCVSLAVDRGQQRRPCLTFLCTSRTMQSCSSIWFCNCFLSLRSGKKSPQIRNRAHFNVYWPETNVWLDSATSGNQLLSQYKQRRLSKASHNRIQTTGTIQRGRECRSPHPSSPLLPTFAYKCQHTLCTHITRGICEASCLPSSSALCLFVGKVI